jgi:hypothetical protein
LFEQISLQHANLDAYTAKLRAAFLDELHRRLPLLELDAVQLHRKVALLPEPDNIDAYAPEPIKREHVLPPPPQPQPQTQPQPLSLIAPQLPQQLPEPVVVQPKPERVPSPVVAVEIDNEPVAKKARTRASPTPPTIKVEIKETPTPVVVDDDAAAAVVAAAAAADADVDDGGASANALPVAAVRRNTRRRSPESSRATSRVASRVASRAASPTRGVSPSPSRGASEAPTAATTSTTTTTTTNTAKTSAAASDAVVTKRSTPHRAAAPQSDPLANALRTVMQDERAKWFMDAVDASIVPTYNEVIREPMHLRAIAEQLEQNPKLPAEHVWASLLHVFYNAFVFNSPHSEIFQSAHELRCIAAGLLLPHLPPDAASFARSLVALNPVHNADGAVVELKKPKEKRKR